MDGGEIVSGLPCVKKLNQLYCGSAGNSYPVTSIDKFIDDNKALLRRMYGELQEPRTVTTVRVVRTFKQTSSRFRRDVLEGTLEELIEDTEEEKHSEEKHFPGNETVSEKNKKSGKEDVCQSKIEIVTPYWASNSNGKVRAILNNKEFEQAIHQEICRAYMPGCSKPKTP